VEALPHPDALLFDLGGTVLLEERFDLSAGVEALLADPALPTREGPEAAARLAEELASAVARTHAGGADEFRIRDWLSTVVLEGSGERELESAELVLWGSCAGLSPAPGVHDLLDELAAEQLPLAAVSNAVFGARTLAAELERHGLRRSFRCIVSSADIGRRKPDPAPFREALRRLGIPAERAWFVGDSFANDVTGAVATGMSAVWLDASDDSAPGQAPHRRIRSLRELLDLYLATSLKPAGSPGR
jgi:putative hydrolase of the HAD superfamily